jgi:hypothetical protein
MSQQQFPQGYQNQAVTPQPGYSAQPAMTPGRAAQVQQEVRFYKSSLLGIASAVGRFQRDYQKMAQQGWQVKNFHPTGTDLFLRRYVVVIYER